MRNTLLHLIRKNYLAAVLIALVTPLLAGAVTIYPSGSLLQPNDVTSVHIRDNTIVDVDINSSAKISATKIAGGTPAGNVMLANGDLLATSSSLKYATSTGDFYVLGGRVHATSTNFGGWNQTWPSADGSAGQIIQTSGTGIFSFVSPASSALTATFTTGEPIAAGVPVFLATTTTPFIDRVACYNAGVADHFGDATSPQKRASYFTATSTNIYTAVKTWLSKNNAPADNVLVSIQADSAGNPSGTPLVTATFIGSGLTTSLAATTTNLNTPITLTGGVMYWLVFERSGATNDTNNYNIRVQSGNTCAIGGDYFQTTGTWFVNGTNDLQFELGLQATSTAVYKTSAKNYTEQLTYLGITSTAANMNSTINVTIGGVASGLSGLTTGYKYYVADAVGSIAATAGTISRVAGQAISTTAMIIQNAW